MAHREVEDLNRQRESITTYLGDLRNLLSNDPSNLADAARLTAAHEAEEQRLRGDNA